MSAAPPTSPTGIQPHPLKGIVNSNDDTNRCAACSYFSEDLTEVSVGVCCGRGVCESCVNAEKERKHCPQCNTPIRRSSKEIVACLKKHSKKGQPWAQVRLATLYCEGDAIRESLSEFLHWSREAAKRGHPLGMEILGKSFLRGTGGCSVDLLQAQEYFEAALKANEKSYYLWDAACREGLVEIAQRHYEAESYEKARTILLPLAEEGMIEAQLLLGNVVLRFAKGRAEGRALFSSALVWFESAAFMVGSNKIANRKAEPCAMICCDLLKHYAQAKFWSRVVKKNLRCLELSDKPLTSRVKGLVRLQRALRAVRDACGGCGAEFEGKERNFCRACRTYCYCSRDCQKMHWNRKEGGHREDCKGMLELKQKMKERKRAEAIKASGST